MPQLTARWTALFLLAAGISCSPSKDKRSDESRQEAKKPSDKAREGEKPATSATPSPTPCVEVRTTIDEEPVIRLRDATTHGAALLVAAYFDESVIVVGSTDATLSMDLPADEAKGTFDALAKASSITAAHVGNIWVLGPAFNPATSTGSCPNIDLSLYRADAAKLAKMFSDVCPGAPGSSITGELTARVADKPAHEVMSILASIADDGALPKIARPHRAKEEACYEKPAMDATKLRCDAIDDIRVVGVAKGSRDVALLHGSFPAVVKAGDFVGKQTEHEQDGAVFDWSLKVAKISAQSVHFVWPEGTDTARKLRMLPVCPPK